MKVGGQAVIEGVMMKSEKKVATAVRLTGSGKIKVKAKKIKEAPKFFKIPFLRGIYVLITTLIVGLESFMWSSNQNLGKEEKIKKSEMIYTIFASISLGVVIFLGIPYVVTKVLIKDGFMFSLLEGFLRIGLLFGYLGVLGFSKDVKRLFQYHGAEHKVIHCYEAGEKITVKNARKYSVLHPRCGTAFIFIVLTLSIIVFSFFGFGWLRVLWKLLFIPIIAGISYEILKLGDKLQTNPIVKMLIWPGLMLQKLTTQEPNNRQIEVSIKAFEKAVR